MSETETLDEARDWLRQNVDAGEHCPCCGQYAKVYKRCINSSMARSLIVMAKHDASSTFGWINVPDVVGGRSREEGKLAYWGLIEEESVSRPDGGRSGWWKVTEQGRLYVRGELSLPKYARIYNGKCLGLLGPTVNIRYALGVKFNYAELMSGVAA